MPKKVGFSLGTIKMVAKTDCHFNIGQTWNGEVFIYFQQSDFWYSDDHCIKNTQILTELTIMLNMLIYAQIQSKLCICQRRFMH
jgi:hypothetical protein